MIKKTTVHILNIVFISLLVPFFAFSAPSILDEKISITTQNKPLSSVLNEIEDIANVRFFYTTCLFDANKPVRCKFINTSLKVILERIMPSENILLYVIDDKIIFYKSDEVPPVMKGGTSFKLTSEFKPQPKITNACKKAKLFDTQRVTVYDTINVTVYDTTKIMVYDSLRIQVYDTIPTILQTEVLDSLNLEINKGIVLSVWSRYAYVTEVMKGNSSLISAKSSAENFNCNSFSYGIGISFSYKKYAITTGVGFEQKEWDVNYYFERMVTDMSQIIGYEDVVTWDEEFHKSPHGGFGSPILNRTKIITRTPIYKTNAVIVDYTGQNTASYISIPLAVDYNFTITNKMSLLVGMGASIDLLTQSDGLTIQDNTLVKTQNVLKDYYTSLTSKIGIYFAITPRQLIGFGVGFKGTISNIYKDTYSISGREYSYFGLISYGYKF